MLSTPLLHKSSRVCTLIPHSSISPSLPNVHGLSSGSAKIPSASNLLLASSNAQVCILFSRVSDSPYSFKNLSNCPPTTSRTPRSICTIHHLSQCIITSYPLTPNNWHKNGNWIDSRSIRLKSKRYSSNCCSPKEPINPNILPSFLLLLLSWLNSPQPSSWRIVVTLVAVVVVSVVSCVLSRRRMRRLACACT